MGPAVGGFCGAERAVLVRLPLPAGEVTPFPLLVGTASFVPDLGYAVPPGEWAMTVELELSDRRRVRTASLPLRVI